MLAAAYRAGAPHFVFTSYTALCGHDPVRRAFPEAHVAEVGTVSGLRLMAEHVRSRPLPTPAEGPSPIEIEDRLPPSWGARLAAGSKAG